MCQTGSRKCAADGIDIDQLHYLNTECPFWVLYYISMVWIQETEVMVLNNMMQARIMQSSLTGTHPQNSSLCQIDREIQKYLPGMKLFTDRRLKKVCDFWL